MPLMLAAAISIDPHILLAAAAMDFCKKRLEFPVERLDVRVVFLKFRKR